MFSRRNILCIFKLVYGVGLQALRELFKQIHPSWSNTPDDAAALDKGNMHIGREEEACFKRGNIEEWDFSLMTTVLLFSAKCALEISRRPGYDIALHELKKCRNKLLGHPSTDRMSDADFNHYWPLLSTNFITLGADPYVIAALKLKSGNQSNNTYITWDVAPKQKSITKKPIFMLLTESVNFICRHFKLVFLVTDAGP